MNTKRPRGAVGRLVAAAVARRWYVLTGMMLGALAGLLVSLFLPSTYAASVDVVVSPIPGQASLPSFDAMQLASRIVTSAEVRDAVRLDLTEIASPSPVSFSYQSDLPTATLGARDRDPAVAAKLVEAYARAGDAALRSSSGLTLNMIGAPIRPVDPVSPSPARNAGIGLAGGLVLGVLAALLRDSRDDAVRPGVDIEGLTGLPVLGHIPRLRAIHDRQVIAARANRCDDSFKALALALERVGGDQRLQVVQVIAPSVGQGSSTVAAGLAIAAGIAGRNVVLVDGDVRQPSQHVILQLPGKPGLLTVQSNEASSVLVHSVNRRLEVVAAGGTSPTPTEFLASHAVGELLRYLTEHGELAILDSHGLFPRRDALGAVRHVDGVVIVVKSGKTSVASLRSAIEAVVAAGGRPIGVVLNGVGRRKYRGARHRSHDGPPVVEAELPSLDSTNARRPADQPSARRETAPGPVTAAHSPPPPPLFLPDTTGSPRTLPPPPPPSAALPSPASAPTPLTPTSAAPPPPPPTRPPPPPPPPPASYKH